MHPCELNCVLKFRLAAKTIARSWHSGDKIILRHRAIFAKSIWPEPLSNGKDRITSCDASQTAPSNR